MSAHFRCQVHLTGTDGVSLLAAVAEVVPPGVDDAAGSPAGRRGLCLSRWGQRNSVQPRSHFVDMGFEAFTLKE